MRYGSTSYLKRQDTQQRKVPDNVIPFSAYVPGRFDYMMDTDFAREAWAMVASSAAVEAMEAATRQNRPAIQPLLEQIEQTFAEELQSQRFEGDDAQVLINNMIKQIMELRGYEHIACGLCQNAHIIKSSGMYRIGEGENC